MKLRTTQTTAGDSRGFRLFVATIMSLQLAGAAFAQTTTTTTGASTATTKPEEEEMVTLSPFTVDASKDQGYRATSTLAGSRINTDLKDVAASITEITTEFMKDVSARDINDVLLYTANTESSQNYTSAPQAGIGGYDDNVSANPNTANRIRGLHSATLMRDYFVTVGSNVGFDSYNVDRITINRGPNSLLFGLGDPSGSVNYATKLASVNKNSGEVGVRVGSNSDWRATLDLNQTLIQGKLAFRLNGLWSDRGFQQQPAYYKDNRVYLTGTYKPFESTTLRAGYERVRQRQNNPNSITPIDHVSSWIANGRPTWDSRTQNWSTRPGYFSDQTGGGTVGSTLPNGTLEKTFVEGFGEKHFVTFWQPAIGGVPVFSSLGISNEKFVNLHDMNLRPSIVNRDMDTFTVSWDQRVTKDLFFNVAYLDEDLDSTGYNWYRANQFGVFVDVNRVFPDGSTNPHFGETYMPQRSLDSFNAGNNGGRAVRATGSYVLDLREQKGWAHWLGKHTLTGFYESRKTDYASTTYNGTRTGNPSYLSATDKINAGDWQITYLRYLGGTADTQAKYAPGVPQLGASGVPHTYWNTTTNNWATDTWGDYFATKRLDFGGNTTSSRAAIWQSSFLNNLLVGTVGVRRDEQKQNSTSYTNRNPATGEAYIDGPRGKDSDTKSGTTKTYGVVLHPTQWLSFHYNKSETLQVFAPGSLNVFGETVAIPKGPGQDYGFSLDLMDGKLSAKVNWFETDIANARMPFNGAMVEVQWELPWFDQQVIPGLAAKYPGQTWTNADHFTPITYGDSRITETSDEHSEGVEIEVVYNPTKSWRIMANLSKQQAKQSNIAPGLTRWVQEVLPKWQAKPWFAGAQTYDAGWGFSGNLQQYFNFFNTGRNLATFKATEGQTNPELREWHFNVINNFDFHEGALKNWNVGGALRWESSAAIGYPAIVQGGNFTGLDLAHAYRDKGNIDADLWVGYTRKIYSDRLNWNIQLNVKNLARGNSVQPIVKNSDGTTATYRIEFGPTWYLSSTVNW